ncbi:conserved membrane hypothetical protein [Thiomonas sp. X19]|nr:conserved membrane hypothetical protein [Thiomonas sp. X19]
MPGTHSRRKLDHDHFFSPISVSKGHNAPAAVLDVRRMLSLLLMWLAGTSVMPLVVGGAIGAVSLRVLRPCASRLGRQVFWAALAALVTHLVLVGSGLLRDGAVLDYASVLAAAVAASALACRRARR